MKETLDRVDSAIRGLFELAGLQHNDLYVRITNLDSATKVCAPLSVGHFYEQNKQNINLVVKPATKTSAFLSPPLTACLPPIAMFSVSEETDNFLRLNLSLRLPLKYRDSHLSRAGGSP
jgi:hypothetical protein